MGSPTGIPLPPYPLTSLRLNHQTRWSARISFLHLRHPQEIRRLCDTCRIRDTNNVARGREGERRPRHSRLFRRPGTGGQSPVHTVSILDLSSFSCSFCFWATVAC